MNKKTIVLLLLTGMLLNLITLLSGCGQKGPLYLPGDKKEPQKNSTATHKRLL